MPSFVDISGNRYSRLKVLHRVDNDLGNKVCWLCQCDCGNKVVVRSNNLRTAHMKSCGCLRSIVTTKMKTTHGHSGSPIYNTWATMLRRCDNPEQPNYRLYGGRGILVCARWKTFINFLQDMGEKPEGMTIDRIDNNGNYELSNCRWATRKQQNNNNRHNRIVTLNNRKQTLQQWLDELEIPKSTIYSRIYSGRCKSYEEAILMSVEKGL